MRGSHSEILENDSASKSLICIHVSATKQPLWMCVCCPMEYPKTTSLRLPKILLNGSLFHSPVQVLMAFSSWKAAQLNQQEAFGQRKDARKCQQHEGRCFFLLTWLDKYREEFQDSISVLLQSSAVAGVYCVRTVVRGHRGMWPAQSGAISDI